MRMSSWKSQSTEEADHNLLCNSAPSINGDLAKSRPPLTSQEELFGRRIAAKETRLDFIRREIFQLTPFSSPYCSLPIRETRVRLHFTFHCFSCAIEALQLQRESDEVYSGAEL
nr:uncharacterized protein LOC109188075 [Ipomoea trifida]